MKTTWKRTLAAMLLAFLFTAGACAEDTGKGEAESGSEAGGTESSTAALNEESGLEITYGEAATPDAEPDARGDGFPYLNEEGFLEEGEYVEANEEEGVWRYCSDVLRIEILRQESEDPNQTWYEAEIWCAEGSAGPRVVMADAEKWPRATEYPYKLTRKRGTVLAVSGDFSHLRAQQKARTGIVIRDGKVLSDRTWKAGSSHFPNLDCLAIWPDGEMQVFDSDERTAEEYLADGAVDVLAFGPWLIRDGKLNEEGIRKYGKSSAQRVAVGMVEKGHYFFMMLEGRIKRSRGAGIGFLAERLMEKECTVGFNLDGGQTASIVFMGHQLCKMDNKNRNLSSRRAGDVLGVGESEQVAGIDDSW